MPSSAWMRFTSIAIRRANCSDVDAAATAARVSARSNNSARWAAGSWFAARVTTSMWAAVVAPSPNAPASSGVAASVLERCVTFAAAPSDDFEAFATRASTKPPDDNFATSAACWASAHACTSRTATRPDSIRSSDADTSSRTATMRCTRSATAAESIRRTVRRGCHTVDRTTDQLSPRSSTRSTAVSTMRCQSSSVKNGSLSTSCTSSSWSTITVAPQWATRWRPVHA